MKNKAIPKHNKKCHQGGFSLVEVSISLAIVSTALVSVLGVLTIGTDIVGEAGEISTRDRIANQLIGELQLADWKKLDDLKEESECYRYFDYRGQELDGLDGEMQTYTALIDLGEAGVALPGTQIINEGLRVAHVYISNTPGMQGKEEVDQKTIDNDEMQKVSLHSKMLVRMGKP